MTDRELLTDAEINEVMTACLNDWDWQAFARAVEAAVLRKLAEQEPCAWANASDLISARLWRERYGNAGASELHTWREGGPTDYHSMPLYAAPVPKE